MGKEKLKQNVISKYSLFGFCALMSICVFVVMTQFYDPSQNNLRALGRDEEPVNWVQSIEYYPEDDDRINELEETLEAVRTARDKAEADVLALTVKCENYERYILEHIQKGAVK